MAHKTGWIDGVVDHDAGVVYTGSRPRYVIAILTRGVHERTASAGLMADLTAIVQSALTLSPAVPPARRD